MIDTSFCINSTFMLHVYIYFNTLYIIVNDVELRWRMELVILKLNNIPN